MTIKPLAAGKLTPTVGLAFVWNTIREQDMVYLFIPPFIGMAGAAINNILDNMG